MNQNEKTNKQVFNYLAVGLNLGLIFGVVINNIPLGILVGMALAFFLQKGKKEK